MAFRKIVNFSSGKIRLWKLNEWLDNGEIQVDVWIIF